MALRSNQNSKLELSYFRHRLRLAYLRHSDDPYAQRIVSFPANYDENPYIRTAGLADVDRWHELQYPTSPVPTPHEEPTQYNSSGGRPLGEIPGKWPGATGLHYTQTIMGNRSGVAGMRVTGRRTSKGSPYTAAAPLTESRSVQPSEIQPGDTETSGSAIPGTSFPIKAGGLIPAAISDLDLSRRRSSGGSTVVGALASDNTTDGAPHAPTDASENEPGMSDLPPLPPGFRPPKFARGAEMEARRRRRIQMRMPAKVVSIVEDKPQEAPRPVLLLDDTSSEESAAPTVEDSVTESDGDDGGEMPSDFEDVSFLRP